MRFNVAVAVSDRVIAFKEVLMGVEYKRVTCVESKIDAYGRAEVVVHHGSLHDGNVILRALYERSSILPWWKDIGVISMTCEQTVYFVPAPAVVD